MWEFAKEQKKKLLGGILLALFLSAFGLVYSYIENRVLLKPVSANIAPSDGEASIRTFF